MPKSHVILRSSVDGRLGSGEWGTAADINNEARELFLSAIQATAPEVISHLLTDAFPEFCTAKTARNKRGNRDDPPSQFSWTDNLRLAVDRWARLYHLLDDQHIPEWLQSQLESTFLEWESRSKLRRVDLGWAGIFTGYVCEDRINPEALTITLPQFEWHPRRGLSTRKAFEQDVLSMVKERLNVRLDQIEELARRHELQPTDELRETDHYVWAVRYQCMGERVTDIAQSAAQGTGDVRTINSAIKKVLDRVGITRRSEKPGPIRRR